MANLLIRDLKETRELDRSARENIVGGLAPVGYAIGMAVFRAVLANSSHNGSDDEVYILEGIGKD